jgi:NAD(P)H-nitrite reductase large subunit
MMRVVVIGNGAAGNSAAAAIRQEKPTWEILLVSKEPVPGYSACALPDCLAGWVPRRGLFLMDDFAYRKLKIKTLLGTEIESIDPVEKKLALAKQELTYDRLILATGSRAFVPPLKGAGLPGNFILKSLHDLDLLCRHVPSRVVVIGSGNIGVETAEALQIQGCQVTLIEMLERIMPKVFDSKPSELLRSILESNGLRVLTGEKVLEIEGQEKVTAVITDQRQLPCDTVIWAVGVRQNVELGKQTGLKIGPLGGIQVNPRMETSQEGIYACGDCIESFNQLSGKPELSLLWPSAKRQGEIAGKNCAGGSVYYEGSFSLVMEDIYNIPCVSMGATTDMLNGTNLQIIEKENPGKYYRILLKNEEIIGFQGLGITEGLGAIMALIKTRTPVQEVKRVLDNQELLKAVSWYNEAARYLFPTAGRRKLNEQ